MRPMQGGNSSRDSNPPESCLLSIEEIARRLGIAKNTLYDWCVVRKIPHIKLGKFLRFDAAEIEAWLKTKRVTCRDI